MHITWSTAWRWGIGTAVVHRLILLVWMAAVWLLVAQPNQFATPHSDPTVPLPTLDTPLEGAIFGVWRRWDAIHYLNLAQNGYRAADPGPTVFAPLTPLLINLADWALPGTVDLAAMFMETLAFGIALTLLLKFCKSYYGDSGPARRVVIGMVLLPGAFLFYAPLSEAPYLAAAVAMFYFATRRQWLRAGLAAALATLARSQGVLLGGILVLMAALDAWQTETIWHRRLFRLFRGGGGLVIVLAAFVGFQAFRILQGLPALDTIYRDYSFVFFVDPLHGLWINLRWIVEHPLAVSGNFDMWTLAYMLISSALLLRRATLASLPLIAFTFGHILVFVTKINWIWGHYNEITYTQSLARYSLILFPLVMLWTEHISRRSALVRTSVILALAGGQLILSALYALGGGLV